MPHPLDGAFERVTRAGEHLADLKRQIDELRETHEHRILDQLNPEDFSNIPPFGGTGALPLPRSLPRFVVGGPLPVPFRLGILVGECIYNLRAALDYLVYELARQDSGSL